MFVPGDFECYRDLTPNNLENQLRMICDQTALDFPMRHPFCFKATMRCQQLLFVVVYLSATVHAENPFIGKWKIDEAKSHFAGQTDSVTSLGANTWKFQYGAYSWVLKADGTDQPTPFGTSAMKIVNATTWQFTDKTNGKPSGTQTWVLSADGHSIRRAFSGQKQDGKPFDGYETVRRVGTSSGFEGTWESTDVKMTFTEVDIKPNGDDGISLRVPEDDTHYSLKFDGRDYPEQGPRVPEGMTVSAKVLGPHHIQATTKLNGQPFDTEDWELSADAKTFTYTELDAGTTNPTVVVLHKVGKE